MNVQTFAMLKLITGSMIRCYIDKCIKIGLHLTTGPQSLGLTTVYRIEVLLAHGKCFSWSCIVIDQLVSKPTSHSAITRFMTAAFKQKISCHTIEMLNFQLSNESSRRRQLQTCILYYLYCFVVHVLSAGCTAWYFMFNCFTPVCTVLIYCLLSRGLTCCWSDIQNMFSMTTKQHQKQRH